MIPGQPRRSRQPPSPMAQPAPTIPYPVPMADQSALQGPHRIAALLGAMFPALVAPDPVANARYILNPLQLRALIQSGQIHPPASTQVRGNGSRGISPVGQYPGM